MTTPISSHATIIARALAATPTVYVDIAELGDFKLPKIMRKDFDASVHNKNIDTYGIGILRREAVTFPMHFIPSDSSQDHLTGLYKALIDGTFDGYKFYQTASSLIWITSGNVTAIEPDAKVEGPFSANVTLRLSGVMSINGVTIGS